ncbi:glyoxylate reductase/hydroxypyruvate reductase-like isoform X1 [Pseudomyrmex gracilis]|uniref:glyoxylate reductase/hydroxypyruvate reductase-like isoform X1 n=2 Tax=Pseudomyrmex gracilis TaxID=219809 RepID=UPI0009951D25|nr:glyoxylate reductase/hydroxypyruvate reductase-like isoform X1 [Pseudomyrmex gracilis]XP_020282793.1 glyoxylate reductase/hydroxypyruvate reductase-like isoform X1 [Pseudomyrmex gracilis]
MLFMNVVRFFKQGEKFIFSNRISITSCIYSKVPMSNSAKTNKPKVLITRPDIPVAPLQLLRERYDIILWEKQEPIPRSELLSRICGADALYCMLTDRIDNEVLEAAGPQLKVVASMSVGVDHLDLNALKKRGIRIGYTPDVLTEATAELLVGLLLTTSRNLLQANKAIDKGEWKAWSPGWMCGTGLVGKTVGIVGLGRIGFRVAEILKSFNVAKILYTSRRVKPEASKFNGEKVEFNKLLEDSDFVLVTVALTSETKYMFNTEAFKRMKQTAIFVNGSRGDVVDQEALITALKTSSIAAAGLDVMTPEPIPLDSELLRLDNCVILPHIGSATKETREQMAKITAENIIAVLEGTPENMPAQIKS